MTSNPTPDLDFDGCNSECRRAGVHTLRWGGCERAPEPEPAVSLSRVYTAADGFPAIGFDTYTVPQLAELLEGALRRAPFQELRADDYVNGPLLVKGYVKDLARSAAHAIVHRNNPAAPTAPSAVDQTTRDHIAEALAPFFANFSDWETARINAGEATAALLAVLPPPADRAAVLREEAALIRAHCPDHLDSNSADGSWINCHCDVADDMERRLADEAQQPAVGARQPDTETRPVARIVNPQTGYGMATGGNQPASTAPLAAGLPLVKGNCPACHGASLFLGDGGYVTCARLDCPEPDAATTALETRAASSAVPGRSAATSTDEETRSAQDGAES